MELCVRQLLQHDCGTLFFLLTRQVNVVELNFAYVSAVEPVRRYRTKTTRLRITISLPGRDNGSQLLRDNAAIIDVHVFDVVTGSTYDHRREICVRSNDHQAAIFNVV